MNFLDILNERHYGKFVRISSNNNPAIINDCIGTVFRVSYDSSANICLCLLGGSPIYFSKKKYRSIIDFEFIDRVDVKPKFKVGDEVLISPYLELLLMDKQSVGDVKISDEHCSTLVSEHILTIDSVEKDWKLEPKYKVKENHLIWSESMLRKPICIGKKENNCYE